ncbi:double zinc ribbon domain-containing protein [Streptomyces griseoruber]|uniref:double zinc ribbon domain-containing protein n=1 Tax=Streptomyces griseoruber TaxID=1943 RepID=UPI00099F195D|nr:zinc ribbon domain-containing protein [Streptomyces griseoruber]
MTSQAGNDQGNRFCKACGTPAEDGKLCEHCGTVLDLPDEAGLVEDQGAAVRRDFEAQARPQEHK